MLLFQDAKPGPCLPAQRSTLDNVELKKQGAAILGNTSACDSNVLLHDNRTSLTNVCALQRLCWSLLGKAMFKVSTSTGINLFFFYSSYTVILGILVFHLSASQESSFLLRKNVNIRKCDAFFARKKKSSQWESIICSLQNWQVSSWKVYCCTKKKYCSSLKMLGIWTLLSHCMSFSCSSVSLFVKQPSCVTLDSLYFPHRAGTLCAFFIITTKVPGCSQWRSYWHIIEKKKVSCIPSVFSAPGAKAHRVWQSK